MHYIPSREFLDSISVESSIPDFDKIGLLDLSDHDVFTILDDLKAINNSNLPEPFVAKSIRSAYNKIMNYRKKCTNYPLAIALNDYIRGRSIGDSYPELPDYFNTNEFTGCGYRGLHAYYQKSPKHYPIEIQYWLHEDANFNIWDHHTTYKIFPEYITHITRYLYDAGKINSQEELNDFVYNLLDSYE